MFQLEWCADSGYSRQLGTETDWSKCHTVRQTCVRLSDFIVSRLFPSCTYVGGCAFATLSTLKHPGQQRALLQLRTGRYVSDSAVKHGRAKLKGHVPQTKKKTWWWWHARLMPFLAPRTLPPAECFDRIFRASTLVSLVNACLSA